MRRVATLLLGVLPLLACSEDGLERYIPAWADLEVCVTPPGAAERCFSAALTEACGVFTDTRPANCITPVMRFDLGSVAQDGVLQTAIRLSNRGRAPLTVERVAGLPGNSRNYRLEPVLADKVLALDEEVGLTLTMTARIGGPSNASLLIYSNDPHDNPVRVDFVAYSQAPGLCPLPPFALSYGDLPLGQRKQLTYRFNNCGQTALQVTGISLLDDGGGDFLILSNPWSSGTLTVDGGSEVAIVVEYAPSSLDADFGVLGIASNAVEYSPQLMVDLSGRGIPRPSCELVTFPETVSFGYVASPPASQWVRAFNIGQLPCYVDGISLAPGTPGVFTLSGEAMVVPYTLMPNAVGKRFQVGFSPSSQDYTGAVRIHSQDVILDGSDTPLDYTTVVNLIGTGQQPEIDGCFLQIAPSAGDFGELTLGNEGQVSFTLANCADGFGFCNVSEVEVEGSPYFHPGPVSGTLGNNIPPTCDFAPMGGGLTVYYRPQTEGTHYADLVFHSNDAQLADRRVPLMGRAVGADICIEPPIVDFGVVIPPATAQQNVVVSNCGLGTLDLRSVELLASSSPAFGWSIVGQQLPLGLTSGQVAFVNVTYAPTHRDGDYGHLKLLSNDLENMAAKVRLIGNGAGCDAVLSCQPRELRFGRVDLGQQMVRSVICTAMGTQPVTVNNVIVSPATDPQFRLGAVTGSLLWPGQSLIIEVGLDPVTVGQATGALSVRSDACTGNVEVTLSATIIDPQLPPCAGPQNFTPQLKWRWTRSQTVFPEHRSVWVTPLVANTTDDNRDGLIDAADIPDVLFTTFSFAEFQANTAVLEDMKANHPLPAYLRVVSGANGGELWSVDNEEFAMDSEAIPAIGDIDGDGLPEIVGVKFTCVHFLDDGPERPECINLPDKKMEGKYIRGKLIAFEHDGTYKWTTDWWHGTDKVLEGGGGVALGDMDGDGFPEIAWGNAVYDHDGQLLFEAADELGEGGHTPIFFDLSGDGLPELVLGRSALKANGDIFYYNNQIPDGHPLVANLDDDPQPEILVSAGALYVLEHNGTKKRGPIDVLCGQDEETGQPVYNDYLWTPPAAGDLDNDGFVEIIQPAQFYLHVYEHTMQEKWVADISDDSGVAVPTVFDFEGDGAKEVVFADERMLYVFRGTTGQVIYSAPRDSRTIYEAVAIADIDNDQQAELCVAHNNGFNSANDVAQGVYCWGNAEQGWVQTRRIWNQHNYWVHNVYESGIIPAFLPATWSQNLLMRGNVARCR